MELINRYKNQLIDLCKRFQVDELYAFGSITSGNLKTNSDIDLLVKFGNVELFNYFDNFIDFKESLEQLFGREVDLVEKQTLKNPILLKSINKNKIRIYEREDSKMVV